jgi:dolichol-phosphate mannosyltransferase
VSGTRPAVSVVLPTYDEAGNIASLIERISAALAGAGLTYEVIVVDDSSPDGTAQVVRDRFGECPEVRLMVRTDERGLASAIRRGIEASRGDAVAVMDTDFNHPPEMLPQMVDFLRYYDLVIGSRFVMGGGMEDVRRYLMSYAFNFGIRVALRTQIQDNLSGFFTARRETLDLFEFGTIFYGYGDYFIRLLLAAWRRRLRLLEVPVFYELRRHGESKTNFRGIFRQYTRAVIAARLRPPR